MPESAQLVKDILVQTGKHEVKDLGDNPNREEVRHEVVFHRIYAEIPQVLVAISAFDIASDRNPRLDVKADAVKRDGFVLVFRTWGASKTYLARAEWIAIGPQG